MIMSKLGAIAKKEILDALRNKTFMTLLALLALLIVISVLVSTLVFRSQVSEYNMALETLKQLGKKPSAAPPQLFPLNLLRGVVDYVEIIGALLGILLGYLSVIKEQNKTLTLLLVRPLSKREIISGKLLGNGLVMTGLMTMVAGIVYLSLVLIGGVALNHGEFFKLLLITLLASAYLMVFFSLGYILSLSQKNSINGLVIALFVWLSFVLILPQIGDTMDPDNQVPGGFFAALMLDKPQEKQLMTHFASYEFIRTGLEQLSITKHFERAAFALFGIKKQYNGMPFAQLMTEQIYNFSFVIGFFILGMIATIQVFIRKRLL
jgi:ABC-2 type transport system permease protein